MTVAFSPKVWADGAAGGTPITADELNRIEAGVDDAHAAIPVNAEARIADLESRIAALEAG